MRRSTLFLIACCVSLGAINYLEFVYYDYPHSALRPTENGYKRSHTAVPKADTAFELPPMTHFSEITERPLFDPSRRTLSAIESYQLRGTAISHNRKIALVERRSDGALIILSEGDVIENFQVVSIDAEAISFIESTRRHTITIAQALSEDVARLSHEETVDSYVVEERHEENRWDEEMNMPLDLDRPGGGADHLYQAGGAMNYDPAVLDESISPPPPPRYRPMRPR